MDYLRYTPAVETIEPDEPELFAKIADEFFALARKVSRQEGQVIRVSHAKGTGYLEGELIVTDGLAPALAQGLFAHPGRHPVLARFSQGPGEILHDRISTHRGLSLKVLGVTGDSIPENDEPACQDFILDPAAKAFPVPTAKAFLGVLRSGATLVPSIPEGVKNVVSKVARATEVALEAVGGHSKALSFFGRPPLHPLADTCFSLVPMRWGDHVAKVCVSPTQATLDAIASLKIDNRDDHDAFRTAMVEHFAARGAELELRAQLATDLDVTPVEDASREWPEDVTPYRTVARLVFPPQVAWSDALHARFEALSFRPAHSLVAHRPLGQVMRARLFVYGKLVEFRRRARAVA